MKEILAIIPARKGSKGLPDKNIKLLAGHPLIAYSIKAALDCVDISRVIVSTDSEQIASIARAYGAEVPFMRPDEYARDSSTDFEVFTHAIEWLEVHEQYRPELIVQLRPTSPIRFLGDITVGIQKLQASTADSLRIVTPVFNSPYKMWLMENELMKPLLDPGTGAEAYNQPRQNLPEVYWQTGTLDVIRTKVITEQKSMSGKHILPYVIDQQYAIDIDDRISFGRAEEMVRKCNCVKF